MTRSCFSKRSACSRLFEYIAGGVQNPAPRRDGAGARYRSGPKDQPHRAPCPTLSALFAERVGEHDGNHKGRINKIDRNRNSCSETFHAEIRRDILAVTLPKRRGIDATFTMLGATFREARKVM